MAEKKKRDGIVGAIDSVASSLSKPLQGAASRRAEKAEAEGKLKSQQLAIDAQKKREAEAAAAKKEEEEKKRLKGTDQIIDFQPNKVTITGKDGRVQELTREEYDVLLGKGGEITEGVENARTLEPEAQRKAAIQAEGQQLAGQVGQFNQAGISPTGLNYQEGLISAGVEGIPRAITIAGGAAVTGASVGALSGGGTPASIPLAAAGAAIGFVGSIASSMIGNFKSQRRDTTTAQQRILDEGKQTLKDWATLAEADPSNKAAYLAEYNKVAAQIDQAYRQMKLDTNRDLAKFETALPNLAEFEAFYAAGGERDVLDQEMRQALLAVSPEGYNLIELSNRRK